MIRLLGFVVRVVLAVLAFALLLFGAVGFSQGDRWIAGGVWFVALLLLILAMRDRRSDRSTGGVTAAVAPPVEARAEAPQTSGCVIGLAQLICVALLVAAVMAFVRGERVLAGGLFAVGLALSFATHRPDDEEFEEPTGRRRRGGRVYLSPYKGFSWKRASGLSAAKGRVSRSIGIPLTRSGRQKKLGRAAGCCVMLALLLAVIAASAAIAATL